jgi:hypothetical protein
MDVQNVSAGRFTPFTWIGNNHLFCLPANGQIDLAGIAQLELWTQF